MILGDPKRAAAYLRVSTERQDLGPQAQREAIGAWAKREGVEIVSWHEDRLSGATLVEDRPKMLEALAALKLNRAGLLVAAKRDRLARDVVVAATIERLVRDAGARVVTADGVSAEDTPEGALMRTLLDAFAQYERAVIRARTSAGLRVKRARWEYMGGQAPLGYRREGIALTASTQEQEAIRLISERAAAGWSTHHIAKLLNEKKVPCRGRVWHARSVGRVLARVRP